MEIERKFLVPCLPDRLEEYPSHLIEQAYICTDPVIRIRRQDESFILTCKGEGMLSREEINLPMSESAYHNLMKKAEVTVISKRRYMIPLPGTSLTAELDLFSGKYEGLNMAEVEFPSEEAAGAFNPPAWFGEEVTFDPRYHNSYMSSH